MAPATTTAMVMARPNETFEFGKSVAASFDTLRTALEKEIYK